MHRFLLMVANGIVQCKRTHLTDVGYFVRGLARLVPTRSAPRTNRVGGWLARLETPETPARTAGGPTPYPRRSRPIAAVLARLELCCAPPLPAPPSIAAGCWRIAQGIPRGRRHASGLLSVQSPMRYPEHRHLALEHRARKTNTCAKVGYKPG